MKLGASIVRYGEQPPVEVFAVRSDAACVGADAVRSDIHPTKLDVTLQAKFWLFGVKSARDAV